MPPRHSSGGGRKYSDAQIRFVLARLDEPDTQKIADAYCQEFNVDPESFGTKQVKYLRGAYKNHPRFDDVSPVGTPGKTSNADTTRRTAQPSSSPPPTVPPKSKTLSPRSIPGHSQRNTPDTRDLLKKEQLKKEQLEKEQLEKEHRDSERSRMSAPGAPNPLLGWQQNDMRANPGPIHNQNVTFRQASALSFDGLPYQSSSHLSNVPQNNGFGLETANMMSGQRRLSGVKRMAENQVKMPLPGGGQLGLGPINPERYRPPRGRLPNGSQAQHHPAPMPYAPGVTPELARDVDVFGIWYGNKHDNCPIRETHRHDWDGGVFFGTLAHLFRAHKAMQSIVPNILQGEFEQTLEAVAKFRAVRNQAHIPPVPMVPQGLQYQPLAPSGRGGPGEYQQFHQQYNQSWAAGPMTMHPSNDYYGTAIDTGASTNIGYNLMLGGPDMSPSGPHGLGIMQHSGLPSSQQFGLPSGLSPIQPSGLLPAPRVLPSQAPRSPDQTQGRRGLAQKQQMASLTQWKQTFAAAKEKQRHALAQEEQKRTLAQEGQRTFAQQHSIQTVEDEDGEAGGEDDIVFGASFPDHTQVSDEMTNASVDLNALFANPFANAQFPVNEWQLDLAAREQDMREEEAYNSNNLTPMLVDNGGIFHSAPENPISASTAAYSADIARHHEQLKAAAQPQPSMEDSEEPSPHITGPLPIRSEPATFLDEDSFLEPSALAQHD
ncbi:hypothetical protein B0H63DRAFT_531667 [Podospora didyma]|uniref:Uncharacterized protein n=1 Tax=Podospora didyma TaxID=330526 RepID=A0AAE0P5P5_9PEZI|nr:hypothetical protein B0H63DRAFT_531667 [Podospora didyma]